MTSQDLTKDILKERMVLNWMKCNFDLSGHDEPYLEEIEKLVQEYEEKYGPTKLLKYETQRMAFEGKHYVEN